MLYDNIFRIEKKKTDKPLVQSIDNSHVQIALAIIVLSALCFKIPVLQYFLSKESGRGAQLLEFSLLSSVFIHGNIPHLLSNMFFYMLYSPSIEEKIGKTNFFQLFIICGIFSGVISHHFTKHLPLAINLGASGAIFGLMAYASIIFKDRRVVLFNSIKVPIWTVGAFYIASEIFAAKAMYRGGQTGIGHIAHVSGAFVGWLYYLIFEDKRSTDLKKPVDEKWGMSDYFDILMAGIQPVIPTLYMEFAYHLKLMIIISSFWNPKVSAMLALFVTYDCIRNRKLKVKQSKANNNE